MELAVGDATSDFNIGANENNTCLSADSALQLSSRTFFVLLLVNCRIGIEHQ